MTRGVVPRTLLAGVVVGVGLGGPGAQALEVPDVPDVPNVPDATLEQPPPVTVPSVEAPALPDPPTSPDPVPVPEPAPAPDPPPVVSEPLPDPPSPPDPPSLPSAPDIDGSADSDSGSPSSAPQEPDAPAPSDEGSSGPALGGSTPSEAAPRVPSLDDVTSGTSGAVAPLLDALAPSDAAAGDATTGAGGSSRRPSSSGADGASILVPPAPALVGVPVGASAPGSSSAAAAMGRGAAFVLPGTRAIVWVAGVAGGAAQREAVERWLVEAAGRGPGAQQRRLNRTVVRWQACLDDVADDERTVLSLRAGLGPLPVLSRDEVAARLLLDAPQVRRIESRGLVRVTALGLAGACGASAATTLSGTSGIGEIGEAVILPADVFGTGVPLAAPIAFADQRPGDRELIAIGDGSADAAPDSGGGILGALAAAPERPSFGPPPPLGTPSASPMTIALAFVLAFLIVVLSARHHMRRR